MTILLAGGGTGGHVFPLLALADALRARCPDREIVFVGTERGMETRAVPARGYKLELMRVSPIRGSGVGGAVRGVASAFGSIPQARALLQRYAPRAVCSIGGYAAGPIALCARALGIPLALIEPNTVMGLANRVLAPLVQRAYTTFPEVEGAFRRSVVRRTGVPLRAGFEPQPYRRSPDALSILVLGGSQGAASLNEAVPEALARSTLALRVTHQAGGGRDAAVRERYATLGLADVTVLPFIDDMPAALGRAELVIGRSGASAVSEICAVGRPSLLVPYPFAAGDHQLKNAEALARQGAAVCVPAAEATPERLAVEINGLVRGDTLATLAERAREWGRPDAAARVAEDLLALAGLCELGRARSVA